MKRRTDTAVAALDESLQADVMRFMAIIAFCLVAIMALARNAAPLEAQAATAEPEPLEPIAAVPEEKRPVEPVAAVPAAQRLPAPTSAAVRPAPVEEPLPAPPPRVVEAPEPPRSAPEPVVEPPVDVPVPEAASPESDEEGLSLRFASDGDFLRLVSRDAIEVFAFREGEVLALSPGLRFSAARAPGQVHELLPTTIPAPIAAALTETRDDAASFAWGVRMPGRIERRVRAHVDAGDSGVLVIDRFGEVRLVTAKHDEERNG